MPKWISVLYFIYIHTEFRVKYRCKWRNTNIGYSSGGNQTYYNDDVIVIGDDSNNIPNHDVPTIIRRVGEMIDDIKEIRPNALLIIPAIPRRYDDSDSRDGYRDKIDRVNIFLQHKCKKSNKLHFLRHNIRFEDY